jgi:hypothetical protein
MRGPCKHCGKGPLNGVGANTGNGLLHSEAKHCVKYVPPFLGSYDCVCASRTLINTPITPSEGSRIDSIQYGCYGSSVTQDRVKELLSRGLRFGNEGTRIAAMKEKVETCSASLLQRPVISVRCPPLPPPPAPPARSCILTKNQK